MPKSKGSFLRALLGISAAIGWTWSACGYADSIRSVSSEVCQTCHKEIYKQWKGSMHAQSTALEDPIHATFYKKVVGDPLAEGVKMKNGKYPVCLQCHAPNAAIAKQTKLDSDVTYSEGVNCVACHTLKTYKGITAPGGKLRLGMMAYETADSLQGPAGFNRGLQKLTAANDMFGGAPADDSDVPNPHLGEGVTMNGKQIPSLPMESNAGLMKSNAACMGCHDKRNNSHGVPLCATGNEYMVSKSDVTCQYCHMPMVDNEADHSMGGGHDGGMLKRSIVFTMDTKANGGKLLVTAKLKNQQPHALPTGAPFRNIVFKLMAYNSSGDLIWENAPEHPAKDDPQAYFAYLLADDAGKDAMPPTATQLGADTRLRPHEERELAYEIPADGVALIRGEVHYNLLWKVLADQFKHLPQDLRDSRVIAVAENVL
ncbi:MAG: cytochrome c family protein [Gammaproteobacteria bacterium]|nr:cytochrome c family protein [Gammaproteobacteria bacterium]